MCVLDPPRPKQNFYEKTFFSHKNNFFSNPNFFLNPKI